MCRMRALSQKYVFLNLTFGVANVFGKFIEC
jgi:hypothetical protein